MSVLICGENRERLRVTGDIETEFCVPPTIDDRHWLGFSDGTLIEAAYGADDDCRFAVQSDR